MNWFDLIRTQRFWEVVFFTECTQRLLSRQFKVLSADRDLNWNWVKKSILSRLIGTKCSKISIPFTTLRCVWVSLELMPVQILSGIQFMRCKMGEEIASKCNGKWDSGLCTFPILAKRIRLRCTNFLLQNVFGRKNRRKLALGSRIEGM